MDAQPGKILDHEVLQNEELISERDVFAKACELGRKFTRPVVLSYCDKVGKCASAIGAFVVINKEGWIVTAWHIVEANERTNQAIKNLRAVEQAKAIIQADQTIGRKERSRRLKALPVFPTNTVTLFLHLVVMGFSPSAR